MIRWGLRVFYVWPVKAAWWLLVGLGAAWFVSELVARLGVVLS